MTPKHAALHVVAVEVHCPHCREPQVEPKTGSMMWEPKDVARHSGARLCNDCHKEYSLDCLRSPLSAGGAT